MQPWLGFTAGWMFVCAKTASAATAALGLAGYTMHALGQTGDGALVGIALAVVALVTLIVLGGIRLSSRANIVVVSITLFSLGSLVFASIPTALATVGERFTPFVPDSPAAAVLQACALMFVAYAGYARITTLGEEVHEPRRTIPRAIIASLLISALVYVAVATVSIATVGHETLFAAAQQNAAPLEAVAVQLDIAAIPRVVAAGAVTAMFGVLLNLALGISRVLLAMGRRGDMPRVVARLNAAGTTPYGAVVLVGAMIGALVSIGSVKTTWSFSAFSVLIYYAITNLAALRLPAEVRIYPKWFAWVGLAACLFLAFWVEWQIWASGLGVIAAGLGWYAVARALRSRRKSMTP